MVELNRYIFNKDIRPSFLGIELLIKDIFKLNHKIYSNKIHIKKGIDWLVYAQEMTRDGGVSSGYSLIFGWRPSYPETSGYIIPTLIDYYHISNDNSYLQICKDIANWECSIQLEDGGFQGDVINKKRKSIIFNTGQVILGLVKAYKEFKDQRYLDCAIKAGSFLVRSQEKNGNWIKNCFNKISHTYNVRTAWTLLKLFFETDEKKFQKAAIKNLNWALKQKNKNFWFYNSSFKANKSPLLHCISYTLRGFLEAGIILENKTFIHVALNASLKLLNYYEKYKILPARFNSNWESYDFYSCLTGNAQISIIWLKLYQLYKEKRFLINAIKLNNYLKLKQVINNRFKDVNGSIKGSDPMWGRYNMFSFPNWATKFFCDALILEDKILLHKNLINIKGI